MIVSDESSHLIDGKAPVSCASLMDTILYSIFSLKEGPLFTAVYNLLEIPSCCFYSLLIFNQIVFFISFDFVYLYVNVLLEFIASE